ncbi:hypothetical protein VTH06DRAFT_7691 [Thermothelomyces fergusii]
MPAAATQPSVGSLSGTPVLWYPMPTPWPSAPGCEKYLYRALMEVTMVAYDPRGVAAAANQGISSCFAPQHSAWLDQNPNTTPSTALGPTFVCPEAWSLVHSTVLESNTAGETQFTYCCPPFYIQCTSTVEPGETVSYNTFIGTVITKSDGRDGKESVETAITFTSAETVIESSPLTIYALPANGYNIITSDADSRSSTATTTARTGTISDTTPTIDTPSQTDSGAAGGASSSAGLSPGAIAGTVVGAVLGLALMALIAFFIRRKYPRSSAAGPTDHDRPEMAFASDYYGYPKYPQPHGPPPFVNEAPSEPYAHELPHPGVYAYELPVGQR